MTIDLTLQFIFDLQLLYFYSLAADYPGKYIYNLFPLVTSFSKNDYETAITPERNVLRTDGNISSVIKIMTMMIMMMSYISGIHSRRNCF